jgi:hypothetical protein
MIYRFRFWKEWCDEQGRFWAEPYDMDSSVDARRAHNAALAWDWVGDKVRPSVSDLYSIAFKEDPVTGKKREENRITIADGGRREYHEATLPRVRTSGKRDTLPASHATPRTPAKQDSDDTPF